MNEQRKGTTHAENSCEKAQRYESLGTAIEGKFSAHWAGVPWWFFLIVWGLTYWLAHLPFDLVEGMFRLDPGDSGFDLSKVEATLDWSLFLVSFYTTPLVYRSILRK